MESCKAGLENRINAKEAQETLKMLDKRATMPWNLVTKLASGLDGYKARLLSTKHSKIECGFLRADLPLYWQQISVLYSRIVPASIYNIQLYVRR